MWRTKQIEVGLISVKEYENIIRSFTGHGDIDIKKELSQGELHSEDKLVNKAIRYALLTRSSLENANLLKASSNFQAFILLSLCAVLEYKGYAAETIDRIIQYATGFSEHERLRQLRGAIWVNSLIAGLVEHGWTIYRATELFLISMSSASSERCARAYDLSRRTISHSTWWYTLQ